MENITDKPAIEQVDFQLSNVKGWISVHNYENALIKAECLKVAVDKLLDELKEQVSPEFKDMIEKSWEGKK